MQCYEAASVGTRNRWLAEHSCSQRLEPPANPGRFKRGIRHRSGRHGMNRVSVLGLAMLVGACASPLEAPESDEGLPIQTDRLVYELRRTDRELLGEISFAFT